MVAPVVVTGAAWVTPLGSGLEAVWRRLLAGEHGFVEVPSPHRVRNTLAAVVPPASAQASEAAAGRLRRLAVETLRGALENAGIPGDGARTRFVLGTSLGAFLDDDGERQAPLHQWADAVAEALGARVPPVVLSTACSSGSDALLVGAECVRAGLADVCVCGGVDVLTPSKRLAHSALSTLSPTRPRAYDSRHDGMLLGEGAAFLVLESAAHAERRSARVLARLCGAGSANDAASMTSPDPAAAGARLAMTRSLEDAGLAASAIGLVNGHGSATPVNDQAEREAFRSVFGPSGGPLVFATKGAFGHSLGATGAMEAIALILGLREGIVPPIVGLEQPDPDFPCPLSVGGATRHSAQVGLSVTLGFGGFDTSLVFEVSR
ncbi:beta-ketoacyl-[acyl-carrier-protein] synthase family protein [Stigmatella aurantiaca]|uniref:3-oxoacyl-[acyl-carrier-protein] synthase n=1 Tax=Stigmatella aurantiaca (strain DW4/3-1) TaxID=378806 RepID=Q08QZ5_STIAD|nr:beta-ketoacyl-[acyl-carrier-protein] synthase family protein [Stigmatella aurantiaca]ADO70563.1 3-oxoacyl-[acyl-carrier-protein] synthase [Stigmatella aurantiaca DW4/3-1]EAU62904.1 3-oxoacyl-[acyl-carrier-protein] synthase II [Stigmatella aurantiaca DW4/3-1]